MFYCLYRRNISVNFSVKSPKIPVDTSLFKSSKARLNGIRLEFIDSKNNAIQVESARGEATPTNINCT